MSETLKSNAFFLGIALCAVSLALSVWSGLITVYQFMTLQFSLLILLLGFQSLTTTREHTKVASANLALATLAHHSAIAPKLVFRIRPARDYQFTLEGNTKKGWVKGVGIYIENIGLGPAVNIKLAVTARAKENIEELTCKAEFNRIRVGEQYSLPSTHYPQLKINKEHKTIEIHPLEYEDIRNPSKRYTIEDPVVLELDSNHFDIPDPSIKRP